MTLQMDQRSAAHLADLVPVGLDDRGEPAGVVQKPVDIPVLQVEPGLLVPVDAIGRPEPIERHGSCLGLETDGHDDGQSRLTATVIRSPIANRRQGVGVIPADGVFFQESERRGAARARMIAEVYDALRSAGADEDRARAAATAIAGQWDIEPRFDQIDRRIDKVEERLDRMDNHLDRLEQRISKVETDVAILKGMVCFTPAFQVATPFFIWQLLPRLPA
jgi:tetrahydromethanopterin S-methyltransferase subunit G